MAKPRLNKPTPVQTNKANSPLSRAARLRRVRNLANLSRKELCEKSGVNIHTLIGWENGRFGGLSQTGAKRIINCLEKMNVCCSFSWLFNEVGPGPTVLQDDYSLFIGHHASETDSDQAIINELTCFKNQYAEADYCILKDNSMAPMYTSGDCVAGLKRYQKDINQLIGRDCIVQTKSDNTLLRQVRKGSRPQTYTLVCHNPNYNRKDAVLIDVELTSAAPIIWHRKT